MPKPPPAPGSTPTNAIEIFMTRVKETPGTFVYDEEGDKATHKIGRQYIKKSAGIKGERIKVTVTSV
jgi:hypothetical protein